MSNKGTITLSRHGLDLHNVVSHKFSPLLHIQLQEIAVSVQDFMDENYVGLLKQIILIIILFTFPA